MFPGQASQNQCHAMTLIYLGGGSAYTHYVLKLGYVGSCLTVVCKLGSLAQEEIFLRFWDIVQVIYYGGRSRLQKFQPA